MSDAEIARKAEEQARQARLEMQMEQTLRRIDDLQGRMAGARP